MRKQVVTVYVPMQQGLRAIVTDVTSWEEIGSVLRYGQEGGVEYVICKTLLDMT